MPDEDEKKGKQLKNPEYVRMNQVLRACLVKCLGSFCLTLFIFNVAISFLLTAALSPALLAPDSLLACVLSLVFLLAMLTVIFTVCYGIVAKSASTLLGKSSSALIFSGFSGSKGVLHSSLFFAILTLICLALAAAAAFLLRENITEHLSPFFEGYVPREMYSAEGGFDEQTVKLACDLFAQAVFCAVCFAILFVLSFVPFAFVWCCLIENKPLSLASALKQSLFIVRGRYWHCLAFPFYASIRNIILCALIMVFKMLPLLPVVSLLLGFFAFLQYYTILSKFCLCIPLYFYSFLSVNGFITKTQPSEQPQIDSSDNAGPPTPSIEENAPQSDTLAPEAGGDEDATGGA